MEVNPYLANNRDAWLRKPVLREIYADIYRRVVAQLVPGLTIEVGGGTGNFKDFAPDVLSSDILKAPWLDFVADGTALPLAKGRVDNLVIIDALHHMSCPRRAFSEAERVLRPGGRLIVTEPVITPGSWLFYKLHPESFSMAADPFEEVKRDPEAPYDANQAIATLFFVRHEKRFREVFTTLRRLDRRWFRFFLYPMSGIFRPWTLTPHWAMRPLMKVEDILTPLLGRLLSFRILVVFEKEAG